MKTITNKAFELTLPNREPIFVPQGTFGRYAAYQLSRVAMGYVYESETHLPVNIAKADILSNAKSLFSTKILDTGLTFVCSDLDSSRSNLMCSVLYRVASALYNTGLPRSKRRSLYRAPEIHWVSNSFRAYDEYTTNAKTHGWPIVLVVLGLDAASTATKYDLVRDLINTASPHAHVICGASGLNPHELHYERLRIKPNNYLYLGYPDISKGIEL